MADVATLAARLTEAVPFVRSLGIRLIDTAPDGTCAVLFLPDDDRLHNHLGRPHAGALFTLGETASGAVVLGSFADRLDRLVPLVVRAEVTYRRLTAGSLRAEARLCRSVGDILAELDAGLRPRFEVAVEIMTEEGVLTAEMMVMWTLKVAARTASAAG